MKQWHHVIWVGKENKNSSDLLKINRRDTLLENKKFTFYKVDISDFSAISEIFSHHEIHKVVHLAAQSWERSSDIDPFAYTQSNSVAFHNIIELSKRFDIKKFIYASTASVYGSCLKQPLSVDDNVDHPLSVYAATKKSNELMAHAYSYLYKLPTTGLRFFTVYWPYGRPDMVMMLFANKISKWEPINLYNFGKMQRTFTYIDDVVRGIICALELPSMYEIFNLWSDKPTELEYIVELIEKNLGKTAIRNYLPMQFWDIESVWSDITHTKEILSWSPQVSIEDWVKETMNWYKKYY